MPPPDPEEYGHVESQSRINWLLIANLVWIAAFVGLTILVL